MKRGNLYFLQVDGGGPIKIGWTYGSVLSRIRSLQQSSPYILNWIGACLAFRSEETAAHKLLADYRLRGEWFHPVRPVLRFKEDRVGEFDSDKYIEKQFGPLDRLNRLVFRRNDIYRRIAEESEVETHALYRWRAGTRMLPPDALRRLEESISKYEKAEEAT